MSTNSEPRPYARPPQANRTTSQHCRSHVSRDGRTTLSQIFEAGRSSALTDAELRLWIVVRSFESWEHGCFAATETLAHHLRRSESHVKKTRASLAEKGWLSVQRRGPKGAVLRAVVPDAEVPGQEPLSPEGHEEVQEEVHDEVAVRETLPTPYIEDEYGKYGESGKEEKPPTPLHLPRAREELDRFLRDAGTPWPGSVSPEEWLAGVSADYGMDDEDLEALIQSCRSTARDETIRSPLRLLRWHLNRRKEQKEEEEEEEEDWNWIEHETVVWSDEKGNSVTRYPDGRIEVTPRGTLM